MGEYLEVMKSVIKYLDLARNTRSKCPCLQLGLVVAHGFILGDLNQQRWQTTMIAK